jgi:hypothetical protein
MLERWKNVPTLIAGSSNRLICSWVAFVDNA